MTAVAVSLVGGVAKAEAPERGGDDPCSGDTIKIGGVVYGGFYGDSADGVEARLNRANEEDELGTGQTFEFIGVEEDNSEPSENTDGVRKLIQQEDVCVILPMMTATPAGVTFAEEQGTPVFGWAIGPEWCDTTVAFGFSGGCLTPPDPEVFGNTWGVLLRKKFKAAGEKIKGKTLAIIADDNDLGRSGIETQSAAFEDVGVKVVYAEANVPGPPAPSPADFTPFANELLEADDGEPPDIIMLLMSSLNVLGLDAKLKELNYEGLLTNAVQYDPRLIGGAEGSTVFIQMAPFQAAPENEEVQRLIDDVVASFPDKDLETGLTQPLAGGYWSAEMMIQMMQKALEESDELSQAGLVEAGNDGFVFDVPDTI
ncbi:MAG TPA: ABC transporter substrate-binding protein, partial [Acidimicrobiia bacterium]|nr:ABC transporter substrate-binding protein [Acidimicrobiia bacterium]